MNRIALTIGTALALTSAWVAAQDAPESLLPPGFDRPQRSQPKAAPAAPPAAAAAPAAPAGGSTSTPVVQAIPTRSEGASSASAAAGAAKPEGKKLPTIEELERLAPDDLAEALGLAPKVDIPSAARRSLKMVGVLDASEGGFPAGAVAGQNAALVRAAIAGNKGQMVSRWGHIMLRRALASRLDAPQGMAPADFAALRAALLVRMGEGDIARAVVQDVDPGNFTPQLTAAALDAYVATADFTGICPVVSLQGDARKDPQWDVLKSVCLSFRGDGNLAMSQLDRALSRGAMPKIDVLLAQKYAGAAGKARRAVKIEWDDVADMTPWRYGMAIAVGLTPPDKLMRDAGSRYDLMTATAPMVGLSRRAAAADRAAGLGVLSSAAMVDLYSQLYGDSDTPKDWSGRAEQLRNAYVAAEPAARLKAMQGLWDGASGEVPRYSRLVLTAYAAARLPVDEGMADHAGDLVASMLSAGLDANALRWANLVDSGSQAWALLALAAPTRAAPVDKDAFDSFAGDDNSSDSRKSAFLLASLAGLGRLSAEDTRAISSDLEVDLGRQTRWSRMIDKAAEVDNPALVALLAGLGMQGDGWARMTPLHLFHIVSALRQVGLDGEARMIAAEAVARG